MSKIPVLTVDDDKYDKPTRLPSGQIVINSKIAGLELDKYYFFDPTEKTYSTITPQETSVDYYSQIQAVETKLKEARTQQNKIKNMIADTTNSAQVNSLADIFTKNFNPLRPISTVVGTVTDTVDYLGSKLIDPLFSKDLSASEKAGVLLNNALVNLGETVDYVTGANAVKALVHGGSVKSGYAWDAEKGRTQYDFNIDTGHGALDFGLNMVAEYVADPTNWVTFGAKTLYAKNIKNAISDAITSTADDLKIPYVKSDLDNITTKIYRSVANGKDLDTTMLSAKYRKLFGDNLDINTYQTYLTKLASNLDSIKNNRDYRILSATVSTMDKMNQIPIRASLYTSVLGWGGLAVKEIFKGSANAITYIYSKINKAVNEGAASTKLADLPIVQNVLLKEIQSMVNVCDLPKDIPDNVVANVTKHVQKTALDNLKKAIDINQNKSWSALKTALNEWATNNGFKDITDACEQLLTNANRLSKGNRSVCAELFSAIDKAKYLAQKNLFTPIMQLLDDPDTLFHAGKEQIQNYIDLLNRRADIFSVLDSPEDIDINAYNTVLNGLKNAYCSSALNEVGEFLDQVHTALTPEALFKKDGALNRAQYNMLMSRVYDNIRSTNKTIHKLNNFLNEDIAIPTFSKYGEYDKLFDMCAHYDDAFNELETTVPNLKYLEKLRKAIYRQIKQINALDQIAGTKLNKIKLKYNVTTEQFIQASEIIVEEALAITDYADSMLKNASKGSVMHSYKGTKIARALNNSYDGLAMRALKKVIAGKPLDDKVAKKDPFIHINKESLDERLKLKFNFDTLYEGEDPEGISRNAQFSAKILFESYESIKGTYLYEKIFEHDYCDIDDIMTRAAQRNYFTYNELENIKRLFEKVEERAESMRLNAHGKYRDEAIRQAYSYLSDCHRVANVLDDIDYARYEDINVPLRYLSSNIDAIKLSQAESLNYLTSDPMVLDFLSYVHDKKGVGDIINIFSSADDELLCSSAESVKSLAASVYMFDKLNAIISDDRFDLPDEWRAALYDTYAGMMRMHISEITPEYFTDFVLNKAKQFIDKSNNQHALLNRSMLKDSYIPVHQVMTMEHMLKESKDVDWETARKLIASEDKKHPTYDILFSVGHSSDASNNIWEFSFKLPGDNHYYRFLDDSADTIRQNCYKSMDYFKRMFHNTMRKDVTRILVNNKTSIAKSSDAIITTHFKTNEEFLSAVGGVLLQAKDTAFEQKTHVRMIGFDISNGSNNTTAVLNKVFARNRLNSRLYEGHKSNLYAEPVDIAELVRVKNYGAVAIPDTVRDVVQAQVVKIKKYLDDYNAFAIQSCGKEAYLIPDFNVETIRAFDNIAEAIGTVIDLRGIYTALNDAKAEANTLRATKLLNEIYMRSFISEDIYKSLAQYNLNVLKDMRKKITDVTRSLQTTLNTIKNSNQTLSEELIIRNFFNLQTGDKNIQHFLLKHMVEGTGTPAVALKSYHNAVLFNDWYPAISRATTDFFKARYLKNSTILPGIDLIKGANLGTLIHLNELAEKLQRRIDNIVHPELLRDVTAQGLDKYIDALMKFCDTYVYNRTYTTIALARPYINTDTILRKYALASLLTDIASRSEQDALLANVLRSASKETFTALYELGEEITSRIPLYTRGTDVITSPLLRKDNVILQASEVLRTVNNVHVTVDTLKDSLIIEETLKDKYALSSSFTLTKRLLLEKYGVAVDAFRSLFSKDKYTPINDADMVLNYMHRKEYDELIRDGMDSINSLAEQHAVHRVRNIINMDMQSYMCYLYKHCQGIQVFDNEAAVFANADTSKSLATFYNRILENADAGFSLYTKGRYTYVYLNNKCDLDALKINTEHFHITSKQPPVYMCGNDTVSTAFTDLTSWLDTYTDEAYSLSMHRLMNTQRYDELRKALPQEIKDLGMDKDYLMDNDLIRGFNHTIVGDYGSGVGDIYTTYSTNIVSNMASGINGIINDIRGKDLYYTLMTNDNLRLYHRLEVLKSKNIPINYKEVQQVLDDTGYNLCIIKDQKLNVVRINSAEDLKQYAYKEGAILLDYMSLDRLRTVMEDNRIGGKWWNKLVAQPLLFLKLGMLQSVGWVMRNIPDSFLKGMLGSDGNLEYLTTSLLDTYKNMKLYDNMTKDIFDKLGSLNIPNIYKYYDNNTISKPLSKELFIKMYDFYHSTSSAPTAAQLSIFNNTAKKLLNKVPSGILKEEDVTKLLELYKENGGSYKKTMSALTAFFPKESEQYIALEKLFGSIPRAYANLKDTDYAMQFLEKFMNKNPLMIASNKIEALSRMHVYLYNTEYTNGLKGVALKTVDKTQFNRAHDSVGKRILETLLPFSSFQIDNLIFWMDFLAHGRAPLLAATQDYLESRYDEEELPPETLVTNLSTLYMFLNGNIVVNEATGLSMKINDSLSGVLQLMANPLDGISGMLNVPADILRKLLIASMKDEKDYEESPTQFTDIKPLNMWTLEDFGSELVQAIPLFGVLSMRVRSGHKAGNLTESLLPYVCPSLFGAVKTDEAGLSYDSRPVGYNWYNKSEEYKAGHRYVLGISYVPSFILKDPKTYANTWKRLVAMGYDEDVATKMVTEWGYYMKAPDYVLRQYKEDASTKAVPKYRKVQQSYTRKVYAKKMYAKKAVHIKKAYWNDYSPDRIRMTRYGARRITRFSRYDARNVLGVSRRVAMMGRCNGVSARKLVHMYSNMHHLRMNAKRRFLRL